MRFSLTLVLAVTLGWESAGQAQVVQLPTFQMFSIGTTVVVPDSGRGFMGGVSRAQYGSRSAGVPGWGHSPLLSRLARGRATSSSASRSGATVSATIHDLDSLDRLTLSKAADGSPRKPVTATDREALVLSRHINSVDTPSVVEIRKANEREDARAANELAGYFARARAAEAAERWGAARCAYEIVARRAGEPLRSQALLRIAALQGTPNNQP